MACKHSLLEQEDQPVGTRLCSDRNGKGGTTGGVVGTKRKQRPWKSGTTTGSMSIKSQNFWMISTEKARGRNWYLSEINTRYKINIISFANHICPHPLKMGAWVEEQMVNSLLLPPIPSLTTISNNWSHFILKFPVLSAQFDQEENGFQWSKSF